MAKVLELQLANHSGILACKNPMNSKKKHKTLQTHGKGSPCSQGAYTLVWGDKGVSEIDSMFESDEWPGENKAWKCAGVC